MDRGSRALESWERRTSWPLTAAAVAFLAAYAWPILDPSMPTGLSRSLTYVSVVIWVLFASDLAVRISLAPHRRRFLRSHAFDVIVIALPLLRPLRALRVLSALSFVNRQSGAAFRGRVIAYVIGAGSLVVFIAALAVLDAERAGPRDRTIQGFGDALWWAFTTITTVGYGDRFPVTGEGRLVAVGLMLTGIALLGVVSASFASWFLEKVAALTASEQRHVDVGLREVLDEVVALRAEVAEMRAQGSLGVLTTDVGDRATRPEVRDVARTSE